MKVIFRRFSDNVIIAIFPEQVWNDSSYLITTYMHEGQHSGADYDVLIRNTYPAQEIEYSPLLIELTNIGYSDLSVVKKCRPKFN